MIAKHFGIDFNSPDGALTLRREEVTEGKEESGIHTRTHPSGWTVTGEIHEDWYAWINDFTATHPEYGTVKGDFEQTVEADSEEGFQHFWKHHEPEAWDYGDI